MTHDDVVAIVELTTESFNLDYCPDVRFKNVRAGRAHTDRNYITFPEWVFDRCETYVTWYAVHETIHFLNISDGHNARFKQNERHALSMWGITIDYARAYAKRLYHNGELRYDRKRDRK